MTITERERTLLRAAAQSWRQLNRDQFRSAMQAPNLEMSRGKTRLGGWIGGTRTLQLSQRLLSEYDWLQVLEVLRHEMAHQYVSEVLQVHDESAHGEAFKRVCTEFGIDQRAVGEPLAGEPPIESRVLTRIRGLLALADSPNEHEARAAARKAYTLMHRHNVERVDVDIAHYTARRIGPIKSRFMLHEKALAGLLGQHFFVRPVYIPIMDMRTAKPSKTLEVSGRPDNVAMAEHVYAWLLRTGERLFTDYKREHGLRGNTERRRFLLGLVRGFTEQLNQQRQTVEETGLVWVGDAGLDSFVGKRHPRLRTSRPSTFKRTDAYNQGVSQGKRLDLKRPVSQKASARGRQITKK